uniref:Uncharacterized protein LOC104221275 n=1 Tax=Nicotiana sylvestris TaxID=4096 RepID=A0A1U7VW49_NICSY|nr:PREDICTED: uncharacterized protein LOC104221275 [Nicotiana sylvestris]
MQWQPLIDRIVARISSWTTRKLSYAGRVQLVQTVIFGIQSYWSQIFIIPAKVMSLIESYCRSYIWAGANTITKRTLIAWDRMCLPISDGGYNLLNIRIWNRAAISKVYWDLAKKKDKMWMKWIHTYYIKSQSIMEMDIPQQASWMVKTIIEARGIIQQLPTAQLNQSSIKQIYLGMLGNHSRVTWRALMFHNDARPKARFTMWMQCHGRLMTTDRLAKWGIQVNTNHDYAQKMAWITTKAKGKSCAARLLKMVYAEYVYGLWRERNSRIFEGSSRTTEQVGLPDTGVKTVVVAVVVVTLTVTASYIKRKREEHYICLQTKSTKIPIHVSSRVKS